jgi:hypothetical protein
MNIFIQPNLVFGLEYACLIFNDEGPLSLQYQTID